MNCGSHTLEHASFLVFEMIVSVVVVRRVFATFVRDYDRRSPRDGSLSACRARRKDSKQTLIAHCGRCGFPRLSIKRVRDILHLLDVHVLKLKLHLLLKCPREHVAAPPDIFLNLLDERRDRAPELASFFECQLLVYISAELKHARNVTLGELPNVFEGLATVSLAALSLKFRLKSRRGG